MKRLIFALCAAFVLMFVAADLVSAQGRQRNPPSGSSGGQQAAPRSGAVSRPSSPPPPSAQSRPSTPPPSSGPSSQRGGTAVNRGSGSGSAPAGQVARPRGGSGTYGVAVPRTGSNPLYYPRNRYTYVSPWLYYSPWAYGAFGLGYWGYDPYWWDGWGYYRPYGWGYPYGYGYGSYYGGYYGYPYYEGGGSYVRDYGAMKLKVKPKDAEVYVDGYYMGQVDDFDGVLQSLELEAGTHRIEVRAQGYVPLTFEVRVTPGKTITYNGELRPGEPIR